MRVSTLRVVAGKKRLGQVHPVIKGASSAAAIIVTAGRVTKCRASSRCFSKMRSRLAPFVVGYALLLIAPIATAQTIARLYLAKPPAGSAYVRVVNPSQVAIDVRIGARAPVDKIASGTNSSTPYRVVPGGGEFDLSVNGVAINLKPVADRFSTIVLQKTKSGFVSHVIVEDALDMDGLKAELRFYNFIDACVANLSLPGGSIIFEQVPTNETRRRAINPVKANLSAGCNSGPTANVQLPVLRSGDHYSLFLLGNRDTPLLTGQLDETEPYLGSAK